MTVKSFLNKDVVVQLSLMHCCMLT